MTEKPALWADLLLTLWVVVVAVVYFGGFLLPAQIGVYTPFGAVFYALMLLISISTLAWNYLHRTQTKSDGPNQQDECAPED
ncbi:MAG: hypothetical protein M3Y13_15110 [Armatimonadota bacterium]|nr:hypothetical protein [Armatimonadota bacterium]